MDRVQDMLEKNQDLIDDIDEEEDDEDQVDFLIIDRGCCYPFNI